jgi:hypothetical protein
MRKNVILLKESKLVRQEGMTLNTVIWWGLNPAGTRGCHSVSLSLPRHLQEAQLQNQVQNQGKRHQPTCTLFLPACTLPPDRKSRGSQLSSHVGLLAAP